MSWLKNGKWLGFGLLALVILLSVAVGSKHYWFNRYQSEAKERFAAMYESRDLSHTELILLGDQTLETIRLTGINRSSMNLAFSGANIEDVTKFRLGTISDSTICVIQLGYNDLIRSDPQEVFDIWKSLMTEVNKAAPSVTILVLSTIPSGEKTQSDIDANRLRDFNLSVRDYCTQNDLEFLNVFNPLIDYQGLLEYTDDQTFLNAEGAVILEGLLREKLSGIGK